LGLRLRRADGCRRGPRGLSYGAFRGSRRCTGPRRPVALTAVSVRGGPNEALKPTAAGGLVSKYAEALIKYVDLSVFLRQSVPWVILIGMASAGVSFAVENKRHWSIVGLTANVLVLLYYLHKSDLL